MTHLKIPEDHASKLVSAIENVLLDIRYAISGKKRMYSAAEIHNLQQQDPSAQYYRQCEFDLPTDHHQPLLGLVRPLLEDFYRIQDSKGGVSIDSSMGKVIMLRNTLSIIRCLARGSTFLGTELMVRLFLNWLKGKPAKGIYIGVLGGAAIEGETGSSAGIWLQNPRVPRSELMSYKEKVENMMPWRSMPFLDPTQFSPYTRTDSKVSHTVETQVILSVAQVKTPEFLRGHDGSGVLRSGAYWGRHRISGRFPFRPFDQLLSLVCNSYIYTQVHWEYFEHLQIFEGRLSMPYIQKRDPFSPTIRISPEALEQAVSLYRTGRGREGKTARLQIAMTRWHMSIDNDRPTLDRFIDLRIALEALYLGNNSSELSYKLANRAAWYLGQDSADRAEMFRQVRSFYKISSKIIHASTHRINKQQKDMLVRTQGICRQSILKLIRSTTIPQWDELTLNAGKHLHVN